MDSAKEYVYKSTLRTEYGLTPSMIAELGDPDVEVKNPHYRSRMAYLYSIERVERWIEENQDRLNKAQSKRDKRSKSAKKANEKKTAKLIAWAQTVPVKFEPLASFDDAWNLAESYYAIQEGYRFSGISINGVISYMRHNCTNYDVLCRMIIGKTGTHEAYPIIRQRVDQVIEDWLKEQAEKK